MLINVNAATKYLFSSAKLLFDFPVITPECKNKNSSKGQAFYPVTGKACLPEQEIERACKLFGKRFNKPVQVQYTECQKKKRQYLLHN